MNLQNAPDTAKEEGIEIGKQEGEWNNKIAVALNRRIFRCSNYGYHGLIQAGDK